MKEVLLCKCEDPIVAGNVIDILNANEIIICQHDETMDQRVGAYGPNPGIAVYVFEKDYEKARQLTDPIINRPINDIKPFCPKCGSEDTVKIKMFKYVTHLIIVSVIFMIVPCVYVFKAAEWGIKSVIFDWVSLAMFLAGVAMLVAAIYKNVNHRCNSCGKKFYRA